MTREYPLTPCKETHEVVALSGGKDSTALALRLAELEPETDPTYLITPTGDELPEMVAHWAHLEDLLGKPLTRVRHKLDLNELIEFYGALPNWRQRWCTRQLKIEPCLAWIRRQPGPVTLCVGLRADEEERKGIYSSDVTTRFPLREWGWGLAEVQSYLAERGVAIPRRTDCARCYGQRLSEWWDLWRQYPDIYEHAAQQEIRTGYTFRSPSRDKWPAGLVELRRKFEEGERPRGAGRDDDDASCRVCRL
jgi:hypothetical protein